VPEYLGYLAWTLADLAAITRDQGDRPEAARLARRSLELYEGLSDREGWTRYGLARGHAVLADLDPAASASRRARALDALRRAAADPPPTMLIELRFDNCLTGLRDTPDLQLLMMDLAFPSAPFARLP
jgi:hypothetical protein